ncbi:MAG TPA: MBL fold metallo-hydrolase [Bacteroidales bacterium]|nr:MBL fold metallo-hydrolase [Bacteroidales bacterium]
MEISVLTENYPGTSTGSEHGLSYLIEHEGKRILFDTGQSDLFLRNAEIMGVDLHNLDNIILSHGHYDHGNGLQYLEGGKLICHPGCFVKRYSKGGTKYIGLKNTFNEISDKFELITSSNPYTISPGIIFLGEIPRNSFFESKHTGFIYEDGTPDFVMDDSAVALLLNEGLFIVTGCGHAGVVNTLEHAKKVTGEKIIYGVMGGFHLKQADLQTVETIKYLRKNEVKYIYPSHCTALPALSAFHDAFGTIQVKTGEVLSF